MKSAGCCHRKQIGISKGRGYLVPTPPHRIGDSPVYVSSILAYPLSVRAFDMENFKRSVKRLITRLVVIGLVVICGAIAIAQANRDRAIVNASEGIASQAATINDAGSSAFNNVKAALGDVGAKVGEASRATHALAVPDLQFNAERWRGAASSS